MTYAATAVKVMIASPSDVSPERQVIRTVIHDWNDVNAENRRIILMPIGWETHSSPDMGDRAQAIINRQLKTCDLLVAVFWTRLGSPTGAADSGTVEEINEHIGAGRPAMIYFSTAPVRPDSIDSQQYEKLMAFKKQLSSQGLIDEYEDLSSFREKFQRHLAQKVIEKFADRQPASRSAPPQAVVPRTPLPLLSEMARDLLLEAVQDSGGIVMRLETMDGSYVQTNERNFTEPGNARSSAQWRGAVDELQKTGLLEDRAGKGELFFVTDGGYRVAELMKTGEPSEGVARPLHYWLVRVRGDGEALRRFNLALTGKYGGDDGPVASLTYGQGSGGWRQLTISSKQNVDLRGIVQAAATEAGVELLDDRASA